MSPLFAFFFVAAIPQGIEGPTQISGERANWTWPHPTFMVTRSAKPPRWAGCKLAQELRNQTGAIAILAYNAEPHSIEAISVQRSRQFGPVILVNTTVSALNMLESQAIGKKAYLDAPQALRTTLEAARKTIEAESTDGFITPPAETQVMLGLYDTGVDLKHPAFLDSEGRSKVIATWNQETDEYCDAMMIRENSCQFTDSLGHGTGVLGIATGNSQENLGVAPGASVVAVRDDEFDNLVSALSFFREAAESSNAPLVVNLSLAGHEGPHDGTSLESMAINAFPHLIVTSAGNEGDKSIHLSGALVGEEEPPVEFKVLPNLSEGSAEGVVEAWGDSSSNYWLGFGVVDANGTIVAQTGTVSSGDDGRNEELKIPNSPTTLLSTTLDAAARPHPVTGKKQIRLTYRFSDLGAWSKEGYELILILGGVGSVDVWLDAPSSTPVLPSFEPFPHISTQHKISLTQETSISDIATSSMALAVGSLINRNEIEFGERKFQRSLEGEIGAVSKFSSYGPSKSPERTGLKPDLVAPGEFVLTARSRQAIAGIRIAENWTIMSGTSMAAPMVSGVAVMLLQFDPELTRDQLRERILGHPTPLQDLTEPRIGRGLVSARRASYGLFESTEPACGCRTSSVEDIRFVYVVLGIGFALSLRRRKPRV